MNNAVHASASFPTNGTAGTSSNSSGLLTFSYDAPTKSYTVTTQGRSQTFTTDDIDAATSTSQITTYVKVDGNRTDSLVLTKPGTSGQLTYRYVGSGFWQRTTKGSSTIRGSLDAFVYGVPTPASALVRTGGAKYDVDMQGLLANTGNLESLLGTGQLTVDFETKHMTTQGNYNGYLADGSSTGYGDWEGTADLSGISDDFSGTMDFWPVGTSDWNGKFFGPDADEVGAVISGSSVFGTVAASLTGRRSGLLNSQSTSLVNISRDVGFETTAGAAEYWREDGSNTLNRSTLSTNGGGPGSVIIFNYQAASHTYTADYISVSDPVPDFGPATLDSADSNSKFIEYKGVDGNNTARLEVYRQGADNSEIQLTYTGLAHFSFDRDPSLDGRYDSEDVWFEYDLGGAMSTAVPTSGSATYTGVMYGIALPNVGGESIGDITGSFQLNANFASQTFQGTLKPLITLRDGGSPVSPGTFTFDGLDTTIDGPDVTDGSFFGRFTGPHAEEIGGSYEIHTGDYSMLGAVAGKRD